MKVKIKIVILNILVILAFLTSHFLLTIEYMWELIIFYNKPLYTVPPFKSFGLININIIIDILLWSGIIIQLFCIYLLIKEEVRK